MRHFSFYDEETGLFVGRIFATNLSEKDECMSAVSTHAPTGCKAMEGLFDHLSQRVDLSTGSVIDHQPPAPSLDHEWHTESKRWVLSAAARARLDAHRAAAQRITYLETQVQPRAVREALLAYDGSRARLKAVDEEIARLRGDLIPATIGTTMPDGAKTD